MGAPGPSRESADAAAEVAPVADIAERYRALVAAMECAEHVFWEVDLATKRVVSGTPWAMAGWAPGDIDGSASAYHGLVHPDDRAAVEEAFRAHLAGRTAQFHAQYRLRAASGGYRWIQSRGRILRGAGGAGDRFAGTITDVTEERLLAERVRTADRLASVGTLAGGIAHEVNNPLAYVVSNLGYLDEALARAESGKLLDTPAELRQAVREALDGAARVRAIVRGLRQFASPEAHRPRARRDAAEQLAAGVDLARNHLAHRARLTVDLAPDLPPVVAGDGELEQVLVNLLVNAGQAIPEGRTAAEHEVRVTARSDGAHVVIEVSDTGVGIRPEDRPRIFDPFFTTKPVGSGAGLGLSVVHGIVTALGGSLEVESAAGAGALFRVILPAAPAVSPPVREAAPRRGRVLIVDDDPLVGRSLARLLSRAHQVEALASPAEVLRRIRAGETWDVVLCDLMMPEMSGMELAARVDEAAPGLAGRFVYLTGGAFTESARAFLDAGRPFLEKPVDAGELRACVGERVRAVRP